MSANRKATFISSLAEYLDTAIAFTLCIHSLGLQEMSELLQLNYFMILLVFSVFEGFFKLFLIFGGKIISISIH